MSRMRKIKYIVNVLGIVVEMPKEVTIWSLSKNSLLLIGKYHIRLTILDIDYLKLIIICRNNKIDGSLFIFILTSFIKSTGSLLLNF